MDTELQPQVEDLITASEPEPVVKVYPVIVGQRQRRMYVVPPSIRDQLIGFVAASYRGAPDGRHTFEWRGPGDETLRGGAVHFEQAVRAAFPIELGGVSADDLAKALTDIPRAMGSYVHQLPDWKASDDATPVEESAPADESTPVESVASVEDTTAGDDVAPVESSTLGEWSAADVTPAGEVVPVADEEPSNDEAHEEVGPITFTNGKERDRWLSSN